MTKRLSSKNAIYTPRSATTRMINYDAAHHLLEIQFNTGKRYYYLKVPLAVWEEYKSIVLSGDSSGTFFNTRIKPFYDYLEATDDD